MTSAAAILTGLILLAAFIGILQIMKDEAHSETDYENDMRQSRNGLDI